MSANLIEILDFMQKCMNNIERKIGRGRPHTYSDASMLLFFVVVSLRRIHAFKGMENFASEHFAAFGFVRPPSRKTIRRRFLEMPTVIRLFMPRAASECASLDYNKFRFSRVFIDKTVFCAKGGIWHAKDMKEGKIPHSIIDTQASWAKSAYHDWRFGYGLHLICNQNRFPVTVCVTAASAKDHDQVQSLARTVKDTVGVIVGDSGYKVVQTIKDLNDELKIFLLTPHPFKVKNEISEWYNALVTTVQAKWTYAKRKGSVEPVFSLIKELFDLKGESKLPYKGLNNVNAYLCVCAAAVQIMMYDNFINKRDFGEMTTFLRL